MYSGSRSRPTVADCIFAGNSVTNRGGGMCNFSGLGTVTNCVFERNVAESEESEGGGVYATGGHAVSIANCEFRSNSANIGGGMYAALRGNLANCTLTGNVARNRGGAMYAGWDVTLANCSLSENSAEIEGGALFSARVSANITNSVAWRNSPDQFGGSPPLVRYSNVEGGYIGEGNIDTDPLFVRWPDPGPDGEWGTDDDDHGDLHLLPGSPAIDAGDNTAVPADITVDLDGNPRFVNDPGTGDTGRGTCPVVDMGAYEFMAEGGCCLRNPRWLCDGDVDGDGQVNPVDAGLVQAAFGSTEETELCNYDLDCDGQINPVDSGIVQSLFGTCEAPREVCP